ncbi:hypothetical protein BD626DRAFT_468600 [Schizophyllum amplum]|uniref:F-box domain-containing protein n=1 Tax=Schizophyllum amplum TaxID=97359 RepID=A0A550BSL1_9AGAR|nr:hypothetical protein BD626DRAFT_468600 [Auriculariopsis ampla]
MHRCLAISEIIALICEFVISDGSHRKCRKDLGSLARSCRTLYPQAVAALWKVLDSLRPLLRSLPADTFIRNKKKKLEYAMARHICQEELTRFIFFASLVKELSLTWVPDKTCLDALHLSLPAPILPNLRVFEWRKARSDSLGYILLFLHSRIARLVIQTSYSAHNSNVLTLLPRLRALCPAVQSFELSGALVLSLSHLRIVSDAATRWENIQSLTVPHVDDTDLMRLATFPRLQELSINDPSQHRILVSPISAPAFPSLCALSVRPQSMDYAINLLRAVPTTLQLHTFSAACYFTEKRDSWATLIVAVTQTCEWNTLCDITIRETCDYNEDDIEAEDEDAEWPFAIAFDTLVHLNVFSNLRHLSLECWGGFLVCDSELSDLARAWPLLETLSLVVARPGNRPYEATIHALVHVAQHCPVLNSLTLDFSARDLTYAEHDTRGIRQSSLTHLDVRYSLITSAPVVAAFLSAIFPKLASITSSEAEADSDDSDSDSELEESGREGKIRQKKWSQVEELLPVFRFVRTQERHEQAGDAQTDDDKASPLEDWIYDTDYSIL